MALHIWTLSKVYLQYSWLLAALSSFGQIAAGIIVKIIKSKVIIQIKKKKYTINNTELHVSYINILYL